MGSEKAARRDRMLIGSARVSTDEPSLDLQLDTLKAAGCQRVFTERGRRRRWNRLGSS
jgi:hypothetical protein